MAKIALKVGRVEVEFEGSEEFIKDELIELVSSISAISQPSGVDDETDAEPQMTAPRGVGKSADAEEQLGMSSIAARLAVKTGSDLVMAAAASLTLVKGKPQFTRRDLITEMRSAAGYFKETYAGNLTNSLTTLVKAKRLNTVGNGYSIPASERAVLKTAIRTDQ